MKDSISDVLHKMLTAGALVRHRAAAARLLAGHGHRCLESVVHPDHRGLHWLEETINVMTLGGLALAVGILVDDATVMIENIDRPLLKSASPWNRPSSTPPMGSIVPTLVATLCIAIAWFPLFDLSGVGLCVRAHGGGRYDRDGRLLYTFAHTGDHHEQIHAEESP